MDKQLDVRSLVPVHAEWKHCGGSVVLLWWHADLRTLLMPKDTHQSARKFTSLKHTVSSTHIHLQSHAMQEREKWRNWIFFTSRMVRLNVRHARKPTHTQASTHAQISWQLLGLFWVWMLALGTLAKGQGEGALCKVRVYVFILFTLCSLNRDNDIPGLCWCLCTDTCPTNKAHTRVHALEMCVYRRLLLESTPLIDWHGHWLLLTQRFSLKCLYVNSFAESMFVVKLSSRRSLKLSAPTCHCVVMYRAMCQLPVCRLTLICCLFVAYTLKWNPEQTTCFLRTDSRVTRTSCLTELGFDRLG